MMNRITMIKLLDRVVGTLFAALLKRSEIKRENISAAIDKVLIIRPGGIGDAVLLMPTILHLKQKYPNTVIDVLAERRNHRVFSMLSAVNNCFVYDNPLELFAAARGQYDVVIDSEQWYQLSAVVARLMGARQSIGFTTNQRGKLFQFAVPYSHDNHEIDSFLSLLSPITGENGTHAGGTYLSISREILENIMPLLEQFTGRKLVAIFPGGSVREKRWGTEKFHEVAEQLVTDGFGIIIVGGRSETSAGAEIVSHLHHAFSVCGSLSLLETAAVISQASLLISGDSGIMHIASALGTKVVALFGPSNVKKWAPRPERSVTIKKGLTCSPCSQFGKIPRCRRNIDCMKQISVNEVVESAIRLLEK